MSLTVNDIKKHIAYSDVPNKSFRVGEKIVTPLHVSAVEYFFEIVDCGIMPDETVKHNFRRHHGVSDKDLVLTYPIESIDEGIELIKQFCNEYNLSFIEEDEKQLRREAGKGENSLLFVIETPTFK